MPRHERHNPCQYAFDFGARETVQSQHVRLVEEPHIIQAPADAAIYLTEQVFIPFEQFRQEDTLVVQENAMQCYKIEGQPARRKSD